MVIAVRAEYGMTYYKEEDLGQNCQHQEMLTELTVAKNEGLFLRRELAKKKEKEDEWENVKEVLEEEGKRLEEKIEDLEEKVGDLEDTILGLEEEVRKKGRTKDILQHIVVGLVVLWVTSALTALLTFLKKKYCCVTQSPQEQKVLEDGKILPPAPTSTSPTAPSAPSASPPSHTASSSTPFIITSPTPLIIPSPSSPSSQSSPMLLSPNSFNNPFKNPFI